MPLPSTYAADPLAVLRELHREGRLAAEYPQVRSLLSQLTGSQLPSAGRLLARLDPEEVRRLHPATPEVTVAVTGHGVLAELIPALTAEVARHGILLLPRMSEFDSYVFDLSDKSSDLYAATPDLTLCVLDPLIVLDELPTPWTPVDVERTIAEKLELLETLVATHSAVGSGPLVLNTLPLPRALLAQLVDNRSRAAVSALWHEANARLLRAVEQQPQLTVLDTAPWLAEGVPATDPRLSVYVKAHLSSELLGAYAHEVGHLVRQLTGGTKKVLAVDLDGTLWGGILGDDGPDGIEVSQTPRGEAFAAFQRVIAQLASQGVLLAAVSKNDPAPVHEVLSSHPEMSLREDAFVRVVANWDPKHENLRRLAEDLNLGVDSMVFVDDSPFECGLVRHELPGVAVVQIDEDPALHIGRLLRDGWFDTRSLTAEDRVRGARYREELDRKDFLHSFDSVQDYLSRLGVRVQLDEVTDRDVPRVSQITMRTNQFNLTTVRLTEHEVRRLAQDPAHRVLTIRSGDRFGDNGLVGVIFTSREGDVVRIDNFLLSCRVFSRGIEQTCLAALLRLARTEGATEMLASYRRTAKNDKVADLYPRAGFATEYDDGTTISFRHNLTILPDPAEHVLLETQFDATKGIPGEQHR